MSGRASKNKGKAGERELCRILEKYLGGNFERISYSGAFIGGQNFVRKERMTEAQIKASKADIFAPDHLSKLVVESKFYKEFPYHRLVMGESVLILDEWISDLEHDCDEEDFGILCVKVNRKGWFICFNRKFEEKFSLSDFTTYKGYIVVGLDLFMKKNKNQVIKLSS